MKKLAIAVFLAAAVVLYFTPKRQEIMGFNVEQQPRPRSAHIKPGPGITFTTSPVSGSYTTSTSMTLRGNLQ